MDFTKYDYRQIRDFALKKFLDRTASPKEPEIFLSLCYTEAVLDFLASKGYDLVKKERNE